MTELEPADTHLYPGATGRIASGPADGPVVLRFAGGASAQGVLSGDRLDVMPHVTAAGTPIAAKRWRIAIADARFRVLKRLPLAP
ncbi:MAG: hypothetical protein ACQEVT_07145 [Pseudomonadota bacterium]|uniref:hypothetical protein n=1 Tax=Roseovarius TaxID=74030 RepID=UPI0022A82F55|nr:hypothetical protein [Roseovarius sp. EGI FJ00037]MCZ0812060.1 hypothetical protein [Roseovarius sp. EGI FJ00037]